MSSVVGGTWTYTGNPAASTLDQVRFLVGDTDTNDQLLTDEEILWSVSNNGNAYAAAIECCGSIIAGGRLTDKRVGDLQIFKSQRVTQYEARIHQLRRRAAIGTVPYAGGISVADKQTQQDDSDRVTPNFRIGFQDNPENRTNTTLTSTST